MKTLARFATTGSLMVLLLGPWGVMAQTTQGTRATRPDAMIDLRTAQGVQLVKGQWRYSNAALGEVDFNAPGPDLRPSGAALKTYDIMPKAGARDFADAAWEGLDPTTLEARRSTGKVSFNWYRLRLTMPDRIGTFDATGTTAVFEIVVDDYAEVWVDGKLPRVPGQPGGAMIAGYNVPNRVIISDNVQPGQQIQLAVFGINGPLSEPPSNFIWIRSATLEFYRTPQEAPRQMVPSTLLKHNPGLDAIVPATAQAEKLAVGFTFTEGPVWHPEGYLLFSDPNTNVIYRWAPQTGVSIFRPKSGYTGMDIGEYTQPGSNGLTLDRDGRLTICEHGNRRITRLERNGVLTVLADRYEGKRLNSPNDLVYKSDGALYFTDPPFGLPKVEADTRKELPFSGIFRLANGTLQLLSTELSGPNGLAFSPDENYLYVTNWDVNKKVVMRYTVQTDGSLGNGQVFFDMTSAPGADALDGLKVDQQGHLYVSGPGGLWILSPDGTHLGTLQIPELAANMAWGDSDGKTLYMTARRGLYRLRVNIAGAGVMRSAQQ